MGNLQRRTDFTDCSMSLSPNDLLWVTLRPEVMPRWYDDEGILVKYIRVTEQVRYTMIRKFEQLVDSPYGTT